MTIYNTKKCKSIDPSTPELKENPNKFIPIKKEQEDADNTKTSDDDKLGREKRYQVDIIATPVLSSCRLKQEDRRTVAKDGLDFLCEALKKCSVDDTTSSESSSSDEESSDEESSDESSKTDEETKEKDDELYGRVDTTTPFNYRTLKTYKVRRSARIAKNPKYN